MERVNCQCCIKRFLSFGSVRLKIRMDDVKGLFQPKQFYDSMEMCFRHQVSISSFPNI